MIKILIVDDSPTEVALIQYMIESTDDMEVVGIAKNGYEAIELVRQLKPNLITMDIHMPVMDGLEATRVIMASFPTPIVIISSLVSDESASATFPILEVGALTALAKPESVLVPSFEASKTHILETLRSLAEIQVVKKPFSKRHFAYDDKPFHQPNNYEIIAVGSSVGGPIALKTILSQLHADFPVPIVIVQHMSHGFLRGFSQWLSDSVMLTVKHAENNEQLQAGVVYIAPEHHHMEIERVHDQLVCRLVKPPSVSGFCPSITRLFQSIAEVSGEKAIGILLTGMSDDGASGLLALKKAHGHTLIQDQESSIVFGMGAVALSLDAVDKVIGLDQIAGYLTQMCTINLKK